ncbi:MAG: hypothetical protein K5853_00870 [Lachnospiraceae bacterium]|nr:hypothetical protein [Lachnospiraceae bacterium]
MDMHSHTVSYEKRFYQASVLLAFLCALLLWHPDTRSIVNWGYDLLQCLFGGQLSNFPAYTYETHGLATNYTLFVNTVTAIWLLPVYNIEMFSGMQIAIEIYEVWYKILLFATAFLCGWLLDIGIRNRRPKKGLWTKEPDEDKQDSYFARGLYYSSGILLISVLGKGQVDIFSLFFMLGGAGYFQKRKYAKMSLLFGMAVLIKPFPLVIILPVLLLLIKEIRYRVIPCGVLTLVPMAADHLLTRLLMPEYRAYVAITSRAFKETFGFSRVEQLFAVKLGNISLFFAAMGMLCIASLYLGMMEKTKTRHYIFFAVLSYVILSAFYSATFYWYVVVLPILAYMGMRLQRRLLAVFLFLGNTCGMLLTMLVNAGGMGMVVLTPLFGETKAPMLAKMLSQEMLSGLSLLGTTVFTLTMLAVALFYTQERRRREKAHED